MLSATITIINDIIYLTINELLLYLNILKNIIVHQNQSMYLEMANYLACNATIITVRT